LRVTVMVWPVTKGGWLELKGPVAEKLPLVALKEGDADGPDSVEVVTGDTTVEEAGGVSTVDAHGKRWKPSGSCGMSGVIVAATVSTRAVLVSSQSSCRLACATGDD
jgi:hypothetical protein